MTRPAVMDQVSSPRSSSSTLHPPCTMSRPRGRPSLLFYALVILSCGSLVLASSKSCCEKYGGEKTILIALAPASFCKCTCFSNSTIIPLDPPKPESSSFAANLLLRDHDDNEEETEAEEEKQAGSVDKRANSYQALSCNDCNKKFCLGYDLPVCKGAKEDDVVSTCFRT